MRQFLRDDPRSKSRKIRLLEITKICKTTRSRSMPYGSNQRHTKMFNAIRENSQLNDNRFPYIRIERTTNDSQISY